jgi:hypothetical protein
LENFTLEMLGLEADKTRLQAFRGGDLQANLRRALYTFSMSNRSAAGLNATWHKGGTGLDLTF